MNSTAARKQTKWIVLGLTLLGLALRVVFLGSKGFWQDEGITLYFAKGPLFEDGSPGLYFFLLHLFQILFGYSEVAGRSLSVITGTLTVPLFYLLAQRLFGTKPALLSTFIFALSPYAIALSQEMRMYSLLGLELTLTLYCTWRLLEINPDESSQFKWFLGVFLAGLAGIYTHVIFGFVLIFLTGAVVYFHWKSPRKIVYWVVMGLAMMLAFVPEVILWRQRVGTRHHMLIDFTLPATKASVLVMLRSWSEFLLGFYYKVFKGGLLEFPNILMFVLVLALIAGLVAAVWLALRRRSRLPRQTRRAAAFLSAFLVFNFCLFLILEVSSSRHMLPMYFPFVLLLSLIIWQLQTKWRNLLLGLFGLFTLLSLIYYYHAPYFPYEEADWRSLGNYLQSHAGRDDLVFFDGGRNPFYTILYYIPNFAGPKKYLNNHNWPADPYQFEYRRDYQIDSGIFYRGLVDQYKHVWLVLFHKSFDTDLVHPKSKQNFGPDLDLYELE